MQRDTTIGVERRKSSLFLQKLEYGEQTGDGRGHSKKVTDRERHTGGREREHDGEIQRDYLGLYCPVSSSVTMTGTKAYLQPV